MPALSQSFEAVGFTNNSFKFGISAATAISKTIPGVNQQLYRATFSFSPDAKVWVGLNVSPTLPVANTMAASANCALNPKFRFVRAGDVLYFNSTDAVTDCNIELFDLGG